MDELTLITKIQRELKEQYVYMESYNRSKNIGYKFTLENFEKNVLKNHRKMPK